MNPYHELILQIITQNSEQKLNLDDLKDIKRDFAKKQKLPDIPTNIKLLRAYHELLSDKKIQKNIEIENLLKKERSAPSLESLLSKFWPNHIHVLDNVFFVQMSSECQKVTSVQNLGRWEHFSINLIQSSKSTIDFFPLQWLVIKPTKLRW